jgi:D-alanine-D-alanine ligase
MPREKLLLIFGGPSAEHEISLRSATEVARAVDRSRFEVSMLGLTRSRHFHRARFESDTPAEIIANGEPSADFGEILRSADVVFPILHGPYGEDGCIQGLLDLVGTPYVGSSVFASALCMDKSTFKAWIAAQVPNVAQVPWLTVERATRPPADDLRQRVETTLGFPCFVKPASQGSSIGVHRVGSAAELEAALNDAWRFDSRVVIERGLDHPRELEIAVLGNGDAQTLVSTVGEIGLPPGVWYDYETKYVNDRAQLHLPAQLSPQVVQDMQQQGLAAYRACRCTGLARIDFLLDRATGNLYLNEINTMPGFTSISMYPKLMEHSGIAYSALISRLCDLAKAESTARHQRALVR